MHHITCNTKYGIYVEHEICTSLNVHVYVNIPQPVAKYYRITHNPEVREVSKIPYLGALEVSKSPILPDKCK